MKLFIGIFIIGAILLIAGISIPVPIGVGMFKAINTKNILYGIGGTGLGIGLLGMIITYAVRSNSAKS